MEFPLTKYVVVCVFSVVFISVTDALTPKERFYEVYTKHKEEVDVVIGRAVSVLFKEASDALCRCLFEKTWVKISPYNESIHATISETAAYNFVYKRPLQDIQCRLLGCHKNEESPDLFAAFSNDEDEYFYVRVFKSGRETARVLGILGVDGLKDNDQIKLSSSPYWCRTAAQLRHEAQSKIHLTQILAGHTYEESEEEEPSYASTPMIPFEEPVEIESDESSSDAPSISKKPKDQVEEDSDESSDAPSTTMRSRKVHVVEESDESSDTPSTSKTSKVRVKGVHAESPNEHSTMEKRPASDSAIKKRSKMD